MFHAKYDVRSELQWIYPKHCENCLSVGFAFKISLETNVGSILALYMNFGIKKREKKQQTERNQMESIVQ